MNLDKEFDLLLKQKVDILITQADSDIIKAIHLDDILKIGSFIANKKPKSKYRRTKKKLLEYLDNYIGVDFTMLRSRDFYSNIDNLLVEIDKELDGLNFKYKGLWLVYFIASLIVEFLLIYFVGYRLGWCFPLVSIAIGLNSWRIEREADKKDRLLRFLRLAPNRFWGR